MSFQPELHPALHPGQATAVIGDRSQVVGLLGSLHPQLGKALDISGLPVLFELVLEEMRESAPSRVQELSKFPAIRRDLALVVDEGVASAALCREISRSAGELLRELQLFDVYKGKGIDSGKKSIALGLTLQNSSRTLTDGDVESLVGRVLTALREKFGATLRD
jgi:phenylalanyl-tRNA synthetase beta chain